MDVLGILLKTLLPSEEDRFLMEVELRVRILEGPDCDDKREFEVCKCASCIAARQFIKHKTIIGTFGDGVWSFTCPCHMCVSARDGFPQRMMPDPACSCEFCAEYRKQVEGPQVIDAVPAQNQSPGNKNTDALQKAILSILGIPKEGRERIMTLVTQRRQSREDKDLA